MALCEQIRWCMTRFRDTGFIGQRRLTLRPSREMIFAERTRMSVPRALDLARRQAALVSTSPGVSLGTKEDGNDGEKLIAVAGRVPCKVDASYAAIAPGDLLTTSGTPGHAMKATNPVIGTILGKALEPLDAGTGTIEVLVALQ